MIILHFVDARREDDVLTQDSMIIDIGAPARKVTSSDDDDNDDGDDGDSKGGGGGSGCFLDALR